MPSQQIVHISNRIHLQIFIVASDNKYSNIIKVNRPDTNPGKHKNINKIRMEAHTYVLLLNLARELILLINKCTKDIEDKRKNMIGKGSI